MPKTGATYERKAKALLEARGFTVARQAASVFPDLIAWRGEDTYAIEVKRASNRHVATNARRLFRKALEATSFPSYWLVQLWLYEDGVKWSVWERQDGGWLRKELP